MNNIKEAVIFKTGDILCGIDVINVQEITKISDITKVYLSPLYISGLINLRGNVVTVIDLRQVFRIRDVQSFDNSRIIIVNSDGERIGILIDSVRDIIEIDKNYLDPPPSNIKGIAGSLFAYIYKKNRELISILNLEEILKYKPETAAI